MCVVQQTEGFESETEPTYQMKPLYCQTTANLKK